MNATPSFVPNNGVFDANQFEPNQGGSKHPIGMFPFVIKNTQIVAAQDEKSGMLRVTFESPAGTIDRNYNLWHENQQTVEIAHKQLSALCHVTGIFRLDMKNQARELVGARGSMEIAFQKGQEPGTEKGGPTGGYVEVKKVFDVAGNEPGKSGGQQQQPQGGGFNQQQPPQQNQAPMQNTGGGWSQPQQQQPQQQQPQQAPQGNQPQWGQPNAAGGAPAGAPPWGNRS